MTAPTKGEETHAPETQPGQPNAPLHEPQSTPGDAAAALRKVLAACQVSAQGMENASELIETRGLKLLFKAAAQQRLYYIQALQPFLEQLAGDTDHHHTSLPDLAQGLTDMQVSMTLQREGRQDLVVEDQIAREDQLLEAYQNALESDLPTHVVAQLESQRARVQAGRSSLKAVADEELQLIARLFDTSDEGQEAVQQLLDAGISENTMEVFELGELPVQAVAAVQPNEATGSTVAAGAVSGGVVGAVIGGLVGLFVWLMPGASGMISVSPWLLLVSSAFFGALFGAIFGLLIGRNKAEDDQYVTIEGLTHGAVLVAVYALPEQVDTVEQILHVHHGRELGEEEEAYAEPAEQSAGGRSP